MSSSGRKLFYQSRDKALCVPTLDRCAAFVFSEWKIQTWRMLLQMDAQKIRFIFVIAVLERFFYIPFSIDTLF